VGDHDADVFITLAAAYRGKMPARQGVIERVAPGACTKSKSDPPKWLPTQSVQSRRRRIQRLPASAERADLGGPQGGGQGHEPLEHEAIR
jgi:hypothetical protein